MFPWELVFCWVWAGGIFDEGMSASPQGPCSGYASCSVRSEVLWLFLSFDGWDREGDDATYVSVVRRKMECFEHVCLWLFPGFLVWGSVHLVGCGAVSVLLKCLWFFWRNNGAF